MKKFFVAAAVAASALFGASAQAQYETQCRPAADVFQSGQKVAILFQGFWGVDDIRNASFGVAASNELLGGADPVADDATLHVRCETSRGTSVIYRNPLRAGDNNFRHYNPPLAPNRDCASVQSVFIRADAELADVQAIQNKLRVCVRGIY